MSKWQQRGLQGGFRGGQGEESDLSDGSDPDVGRDETHFGRAQTNTDGRAARPLENGESTVENGKRKRWTEWTRWPTLTERESHLKFGEK